MNEDQITSLAREYAEELSPDNKVEREMIELDCLGFLDRVLNNYCLVEKSKIREAYKDAQKDQHNSEGDFALTLAGRNRSAVLIDIFPEIAKEVEG